MSPVRYSRAALPAPFEYEIPAQTVRGQVGFTDGIYLRDLAHPRYREMFDFESTRTQALKTCCLFVLFGLEDCAAELMLQHPELSVLPERDELLDLLTPATFGPLTYRQYVERFNGDPSLFLPSRVSQAVEVAHVPHASITVPLEASAIPGVGLDSVVERPDWQPARVVRTERAVKVVTAPAPWTFAAEVAFDRELVHAGAPCFLRLRLKVKQGSVGVCVVSTDGGQLIDELPLKPEPDYQTIVLRITALDQNPRIIIRNVEQENRPSVVTIRGVELLQTPATAAAAPPPAA
jgi:hypothetical protein